MTRRSAPPAQRSPSEPMIERGAVTFRSLHPPRRSWVDNVPPPLTLDDYITISVARVRWAEGQCP
ncbi:hypothetical protein [Hansschlegelia zhihuaiae]|uniref:Uncharacterized protein n=1 Tax=Hansschlegelia zhihuaiae TaxID=405005 RepID=A0A4Q0MFN1_9HYPH|nr:hypothetical protein [Hansschlegelia zhihuaiae]RXF72104.1 hypothetical protein EK403_14945 [Hansschlegelia zhihuaiae]